MIRAPLTATPVWADTPPANRKSATTFEEVIDPFGSWFPITFGLFLDSLFQFPIKVSGRFVFEEMFRCPRCRLTLTSSQDLRDHETNMHDLRMAPAFSRGKAVCCNCGVLRDCIDSHLATECAAVSLECDEDISSIPDLFSPGPGPVPRPVQAKPPAKPVPARPEKPVSEDPFEGHSTKKRKVNEIFDDLKKTVLDALEVMPQADAADAAEASILRAEVDIANQNIEILRAALDAEREKVRCLQEVPRPSPICDLGFGDREREGLRERLRERLHGSASNAFGAWVRVSFGTEPDPEARVCPPIVLLEEAFPGKSLALIKAQSGRARKTMSSLVDDVSIESAVKKAYRGASMRYHPDKRKNLPGDGISLIGAQYKRIYEIFSDKRPAAALVTEFHDYCKECLEFLEPGKPWRKVWDYLMSDAALDGAHERRKGAVERWVSERLSLVNDILDGKRVTDLDRFRACMSSSHYPERALLIPDAPRFPFD
jgi:uncharacterized C2H2 Zn-finger protein